RARQPGWADAARGGRPGRRRRRRAARHADPAASSSGRPRGVHEVARGRVPAPRHALRRHLREGLVRTEGRAQRARDPDQPPRPGSRRSQAARRRAAGALRPAPAEAGAGTVAALVVISWQVRNVRYPARNWNGGHLSVPARLRLRSPVRENPKVAIVGAGRVGCAVGLALAQSGYEIAAAWSLSRRGRDRAHSLLNAAIPEP